MILLFVLGVMNLAWVAVLAVFVLAEKVLLRGEAISVVGGVVMIVWGVAAFLGA
jgi:predicted metal-binding membrane protein